MAIEKKIDVVKMLRGARTLEEAFKTLRLNKIGVRIVKEVRSDIGREILLIQTDYVILSGISYLGQDYIHPYWTNIMYVPKTIDSKTHK
ncbi:MAG: hypothetical protein AABY15_01445 [Nanoarchaeota archaeon]